MQMLSEELDRQDFEAWFVPRFHPRHMHRNKMGNYYFMDADIAWTVWQARSAELRSLREQLAELKAMEPFGYIDSVYTGNWNYINLKSETSTVAFISKTAEGMTRPDYAIPLFTAAKSVGLDMEDITEFMRKAFWRGFESARGTENSNIPEHWKESKTNLLLALKAKISGD